MTYNHLAPYYDELHRAEQEKKIQYAKPLITGKVLDLGAGTGMLADYVDADILGIEPSPKMAAEAATKPITMIQEKVSYIEKLPDNNFDSCTCFTAAHYFNNSTRI